MNHDEASRKELIKHRCQQAIVVGGIGGILTDIAYALIGPWDTAFTLAGAVCTAVFVIGVVWGIGHDEADCLVCIERFPIEQAEDMAQRYAGSLRGAHALMAFQETMIRLVRGVCTLVRRKPVLVPAHTAVLVGSLFVIGTFMVVSTLWVPRPWGTVAFMTVVVWQVVVVGRHQRLQPWCRWCRRDDGGGDHEEVPDPDPASGKNLNVS